MKPSKVVSLTLVALWLSTIAQAHPGHDGHELVWEYSGGHFHLDGIIYLALATLTITAAYRLAKKRV